MNVRRAINVVLLGTVVASAVTMYAIKTASEREAAEIRRLTERIAAERQRVSELTAEWSALDHPSRLQDLLERHNGILRLEPIAARQIRTIDMQGVGSQHGAGTDGTAPGGGLDQGR